MPFRSQAQWHHLFAREARGEVPAGTALEMARASPPYESLPVYAGEDLERLAPALQWLPRIGEDNLGVVPGKPPLVSTVVRSRPGAVMPVAAARYPTRSSARAPSSRPSWRPLVIGGLLAGALALAFGRAAK